MKREITKEQYDKIMKDNNRFSNDILEEIFSQAELYGYGIYSPNAVEIDGKYYVSYWMGSTCD